LSVVVVVVVVVVALVVVVVVVVVVFCCVLAQFRVQTILPFKLRPEMIRFEAEK
jgi:hypothetical protein